MHPIYSGLLLLSSLYNLNMNFTLTLKYNC